MAATQIPPDATGDFGDYVQNDEEIDAEEVAEPWYSYKKEKHPDTFYPIYLGEVLKDRYLIEHKLGHGGGTTIWMAHDRESERDVAIKIMKTGGWGSNEVHMQNEVIQHVQDSSHLLISLASFVLPGDDGQEHQVLVLALIGPSIQSLILSEIPVASRMSAARQLLEALEGLHKASIVHCDISPGNCMWGLAPLHDLTRSAKYEALGQPLKQTIPWFELRKKGELITPAMIPDSLRTEDFYLSDFGLAKKLGDTETQPGQPPNLYCSPERLHRKPPTPACDIWSYMVFHASGLSPRVGRALYIYDEYPDSWYDQSLTVDQPDYLASRLARFRPDADLTERDQVLSLIKKVFVFRPEERPTATELLRDYDFREIMDRYDF